MNEGPAVLVLSSSLLLLEQDSLLWSLGEVSSILLSSKHNYCEQPTSILGLQGDFPTLRMPVSASSDFDNAEHINASAQKGTFLRSCTNFSEDSLNDLFKK